MGPTENCIVRYDAVYGKNTVKGEWPCQFLQSNMLDPDSVKTAKIYRTYTSRCETTITFYDLTNRQFRCLIQCALQADSPTTQESCSKKCKQ